jgi:antitoxin HicB
MSIEWIYQVEIRQEEDEFVATCPDLREVLTGGFSQTEALAQVQDAVAVAVRGRMKDGTTLDPPHPCAPGSLSVRLPAPLAAKAAVYYAWQRADISKVAFGARIGRTESEVRRLLDPDHGSRLDQIEAAIVGLGRRLIIALDEG